VPELPEIQTLRDDLEPVLLGLRLRSVRLSRMAPVHGPRSPFYRELPGRRITGLRRRGKYLELRFEGNRGVLVHLGMSGRLSHVPLPPGSRDHVHMVLRFEGGGRAPDGPREGPVSEVLLVYRDPRRFGSLRVVSEGGERVPPLSALGPDALEVDREEFVRLFAGRRAPIKSLLLDQRILAGVGNIYADEALFSAGIHPLERGGDLPPGRLLALRREMRRVLHRAIAWRGSTLRDYRDGQGREGKFRALHRVYGREGRACPRCGNAVVRILIGNRSARLCPGCQVREEPAGRAVGEVVARKGAGRRRRITGRAARAGR
jgi:formamidopyrimidine-DNA glycosylase